MGGPMELVGCQPVNPNRPVDWRWRRARTLQERRQPPHPEFDDPWIARALPLMGLLDGHYDVAPPDGLIATDPAVAAAYQLRFAADPRRRWEVEGRLLADQRVEVIADYLG